MLLKKIPIKKILALLTMGYTLFAIIPYAKSSVNQIGSISIDSGYITMTSPNILIFNATFLPISGSINIYKILQPQSDNEYLQVSDTDSTGQNFHVTMAFSNLLDGTNILPFTNISTVTLAQDTTYNVDIQPQSLPLPDANVTAIIPCPWDGLIGTLEDNCGIELNSNTFIGNSIVSTVDPAIFISSTATLIPVTNSNLYVKDEIIIFNDNGEKALVTQVDPGVIHTKRGVLGSTAASHLPNTGIIPVGPESIQLDILDGPEPIIERIGAYSIGFGFKSLIEPFFEPGNYTGTITYSLYIT